MAGLGRRTHYRKHLTDSILYDLPTPGPSERIAKIASTRGSNQFDVLVSTTAATAAAAVDGHPDRVPQLAILPTKFRKLVWIKRNDYVIVDTGSPSMDDTPAHADQRQGPRNSDENATRVEGSPTDESGGSGVRLIITHILYRDQVKHLKAEGIWPSHDPEFAQSAPNAGDDDDGDDSLTDGGNSDVEAENLNALGSGCDDGIVYDDDDDGELFLNTNRVAALRVDDSSSSDDESQHSK